MCDDQKTRPARAQGTCRAEGQARGYPSDLTDAQWQVIVVHLPAEVPGRRGRPQVWPVRRIVEAILYVDRAGCAWPYLLSDFPPWRTVYGYFAAWRDDGTLTRLHDVLHEESVDQAVRVLHRFELVTCGQSDSASSPIALQGSTSSGFAPRWGKGSARTS